MLEEEPWHIFLMLLIIPSPSVVFRFVVNNTKKLDLCLDTEWTSFPLAISSVTQLYYDECTIQS